jgi:hypothetical protein
VVLGERRWARSCALGWRVTRRRERFLSWSSFSSKSSRWRCYKNIALVTWTYLRYVFNERAALP